MLNIKKRQLRKAWQKKMFLIKTLNYIDLNVECFIDFYTK